MFYALKLIVFFVMSGITIKALKDLEGMDE